MSVYASLLLCAFVCASQVLVVGGCVKDMFRAISFLTVTRRCAYAKQFAAGIAAASPSRVVSSGVAAICGAGAAAECAKKQSGIPLVHDGTVRLLNAEDGAGVVKHIMTSFGPGGADVAVEQKRPTIHGSFSPRRGDSKASKKGAADAKPAGLDEKAAAPAPAPAPASAPAPAPAPAAASAPAPATAPAPAGGLKIEPPVAKAVKQEPAAPEAPKKEPSAAKDEKKSSWSGPSTCPGIRPAFAKLAGPVGFIAAALESTCEALQTSGEMDEEQAVEVRAPCVPEHHARAPTRRPLAVLREERAERVRAVGVGGGIEPLTSVVSGGDRGEEDAYAGDSRRGEDGRGGVPRRA